MRSGILIQDKAYLEWLARKDFEARMAKVQEAARRAKRAAAVREELRTHDDEVLAASIARWPVNVPVSAQPNTNRLNTRYSSQARFIPAFQHSNSCRILLTTALAGELDIRKSFLWDCSSRSQSHCYAHVVGGMSSSVFWG